MDVVGVIVEDAASETCGDEIGYAGWIGVGFECYVKAFVFWKLVVFSWSIGVF